MCVSIKQRTRSLFLCRFLGRGRGAIPRGRESTDCLLPGKEVLREWLSSLRYAGFKNNKATSGVCSLGVLNFRE